MVTDADVFTLSEGTELSLRGRDLSPHPAAPPPRPRPADGDGGR